MIFGQSVGVAIQQLRKMNPNNITWVKIFPGRYICLKELVKVLQRKTNLVGYELDEEDFEIVVGATSMDRDHPKSTDKFFHSSTIIFVRQECQKDAN